MKEDLIVEAVKVAKEESKERKFLESMELAINLKEVDLSDPKNRITEEVALPHGRGKPIKVCVIGSEETRFKVKDKVDFVFGPEELNKFGDDKKSFKKIVNQIDYFIADTSLMPIVGRRLGQVLGPRGKMPKPLTPGQDVEGLISTLRKSVRIRTRDKITFHVPVGTKEMDNRELAENIMAILKRVMERLEKGSGNISSVYVKTTMGKPVKLRGESLS